MRYRYLVALICCLTLVSSCTDVSQDEESKADDFEAFYERFHENEAYQLGHILFPLQGVSSQPEDNTPQFRWQKEDWQMHQIFDETKTGFRSSFTRIGDNLVIESIVHKQGTYGMERRFSKLDGQEWFLIYFADLHPIE